MDEQPAPERITYTCTVCGKTAEAPPPLRQLCLACHEEFHQWLAGVLRPLCKEGEEPLNKLYCFPRD